VSASSLEARVRARLDSVGAAAGERWVVAVSGGLDSVVLLHLLRFGVPADVGLVAAHFDHAMRPESHEDARWVRDLAASWGVEHVEGRAGAALSGEAQAREARYAFLESVRRERGARLVLTAHHADDQAETVLFRALRGTGLTGLAGMAPLRDAIFRPLLGVWRAELEAYARRHGLSWREDATNARLDYARNALRARVLPDIEGLVAPGARRALVRLADLAREDEAAWESVLPTLLERLGVVRFEHGLDLDHAALCALHPAVRARVLRALVAQVGVALDEDATRRGVEFVDASRSGQSIDLRAGLELRRDLDRMLVSRRTKSPGDRPLVIPDSGPGSGRALLAGRDLAVTWGLRSDARGKLVAAFDIERLRFPLCVRAREPGDRIRLDGGSKKVKKLLLERRIPLHERSRVPLLIDARGDVLWIAGVALSAHVSPGTSTPGHPPEGHPGGGVGSGSDDGLCIGIG